MLGRSWPAQRVRRHADLRRMDPKERGPGAVPRGVASGLSDDRGGPPRPTAHDGGRRPGAGEVAGAAAMFNQHHHRRPGRGDRRDRHRSPPPGRRASGRRPRRSGRAPGRRGGRGIAVRTRLSRRMRRRAAGPRVGRAAAAIAGRACVLRLVATMFSAPVERTADRNAATSRPHPVRALASEADTLAFASVAGLF